jgi:hypothetical protein
MIIQGSTIRGVTVRDAPVSVPDILASVLVASLSAYNSAGVNAVVPITTSEYITISTLSGATIVGMNNLSWANGSFYQNGVSKNGSYAVSSGSNYVAGYPVAFAVNYHGYGGLGYNSAVQLGYNLTTSTLSTATGFTLTSKSAAITTPITGILYAVIKKPQTSVPNGSYITLWAAGTAYVGALSNNTGDTGYFNLTANDASTATTSVSGGNSITAIQVIELPTKQW